jgi:hypothetical protein
MAMNGISSRATSAHGTQGLRVVRLGSKADAPLDFGFSALIR